MLSKLRQSLRRNQQSVQRHAARGNVQFVSFEDRDFDQKGLLVMSYFPRNPINAPIIPAIYSPFRLEVEVSRIEQTTTLPTRLENE